MPAAACEPSHFLIPCSGQQYKPYFAVPAGCGHTLHIGPCQKQTYKVAYILLVICNEVFASAAVSISQHAACLKVSMDLFCMQTTTGLSVPSQKQTERLLMGEFLNALGSACSKQFLHAIPQLCIQCRTSTLNLQAASDVEANMGVCNPWWPCLAMLKARLQR